MATAAEDSHGRGEHRRVSACWSGVKSKSASTGPRDFYLGDLQQLEQARCGRCAANQGRIEYQTELTSRRYSGSALRVTDRREWRPALEYQGVAPAPVLLGDALAYPDFAKPMAQMKFPGGLVFRENRRIQTPDAIFPEASTRAAINALPTPLPECSWRRIY